MEIPITERSNPLSSNIDVSSTNDMVQIFSQCDEEIFQGYQGSKGLFDTQVLTKLEKLSVITSQILSNPEKNAIVLSGCGTSGRLAFMVATNFNQKLKSLGQPGCFHYLIAGNDTALFTSQEAIEDDPGSGMISLKEEIKGKDKILYIGITCGFSAPYIGGQLEYSMEHLDHIVPVLLGFNPVNLSRNTMVEKWDKTFRHVAVNLDKLQNSEKGFIINPIVGPEPITGSSRMKGGSATKILLDVLFTSAFAKRFKEELHILKQPSIENFLKIYFLVKKSTYENLQDIGKGIELAGKCLAGNGNLYYLSDLRCGVVGMIDSSECPPTFGSSLYDVRGFIKGGYQSLQNKEGQMENLFDISTGHFMTEIRDNLTSKDAVIILQQYEDLSSLISQSAECIRMEVLNDTNNDNTCDHKAAEGCRIKVSLLKQQLFDLLGEAIVEFCWPFYIEMSLKWLCNCISTGAHIIKGKVYENYMIDVKVSNDKLYHRSIGIVEKFAKCSPKVAEEGLLKAIYEVDKLSTKIHDVPISTHIEVATPKTGIVPIAIVMCKMQYSYQNARSVLQKCPIVRQTLENLNI